jgi:hypothetical protein
VQQFARSKGPALATARFPISPQLSLFLYDRDIYKIGPVGRGAIDIS